MKAKLGHRPMKWKIGRWCLHQRRIGGIYSSKHLTNEELYGINRKLLNMIKRGGQKLIRHLSRLTNEVTSEVASSK